MKKIDIDNPKDEKEKLLCELMYDLHEVTNAFVKINENMVNNEILFKATCDAVIAHAGNVLIQFSKLTTDKKLFIEYCRGSFDEFFQKIEKGITNDRTRIA